MLLVGCSEVGRAEVGCSVLWLGCSSVPVLHADRPRAKAEQTATSQTYFEPRICLRMVWSVMRCDGFHSVLHGCQWVTGWSFGSFPSLCLEPGPALLSRTII